MKKNKPDIAQIKKYLKGELSSHEMHKLERQAQDDPLLMDLMTGMEQGDPAMHAANLSAVNQLIRERAQIKPVRKITPMWMMAASIVFALMVIGFWFIRDNQHKEGILVQESSAKKERQSAPELKVDSAPLIAAKPLSKHPVEKNPPIKPKRKVLAYRQPKEDGEKLPEREAYALRATDSSTNLLAAQAVRPTINGRKLPVSDSTSLLIKGVVKDEENQMPLPGVIVKSSNQQAATRTDSNGHFALLMSPRDKEVQLSSLGYDHQEVNVEGKDSLMIAMNPNRATFDEVVAVEYDKAQKGKALNASRLEAKQEGLRITSGDHLTLREASETTRPLIGWEAYDRYLREGASSIDGTKGVVSLAFQVDSMGRPIKLRILKGLTKSLDEKAKALILHGSRWEKQPAHIEIKVAIPFN